MYVVHDEGGDVEGSLYNSVAGLTVTRCMKSINSNSHGDDRALKHRLI